MVEIPLDLLRQVYIQLKPVKLNSVGYCRNPHPLYITEEHCPPKRAPEIPRRE